MVQQPLDDKPGYSYDDEMGWYRAEDTDVDDTDDTAGETTSAESNSDQPSREKQFSNKDLAAKESADQGDKDNMGDDELSSLYKGSNKDKRKGKFRLSRKQGGIVGAISAFFMSALIALIMQGPNVIVNNLKEMLIGRIGTIQMYHQRKYTQSKFARTKNIFSRNGRLGQSIITEMESKGYKFTFDPADRSKIKGLTMPDGKNTLVLDGIGEHIDDYLEKRHPFRSARWKTKRMDAFYKKFGVSRKSVVDTVATRAGPSEPNKIVNKEIAGQVVEDEPIDVRTEANDASNPDETPEEKAAREANDATNQGVDAGSNQIAEDIEAGKKELTEEGLDLREVKSPIVNASEEIADGLGEEALDLAEGIAKGTLTSKTFDAVKGFFNPTDIVDKVCTLRNRLRMAQMAGRSLKALKLLRYAGVFINAADSTRAGRADPKLLNEVMKRVMANDTTGNPIGASPGFGYLLKNKFSKSRNETTKNRVAVDGELGGVYGGIKDSTDRLLATGNVGSKCWLFQNPAFQITTGVIDVAVKAVGCIFTGCAASEAELAAQEAAEATVTSAIKSLIKEKIEQVFTKEAFKKLAIGAATGIALDLSFEGAMTLVQMYAEQTMRLPFTGQEKGAQLGDILVAGTGTLNKQRSLRAGMVPATTRQYAAAKQDYIAWHKEQINQQSFATRMFDTNNLDSLAFKGISSMITVNGAGLGGTVNNISNMATSLFTGGPLTMIGDIFGGSAAAGSNDEVDTLDYPVKDQNGNPTSTELATDFAGNLQVILRDDIAAIDTDSNIDYLINSGDIDSTTLEPISSAFIKHIEDCVENPDILSKLEFESGSTDCMATQEITKRYKAHLAYMDMTDRLQAEYDPSALDESDGSGSGASPTGTATTTVDMANLYQASDSIGCASGTRDLGVYDGYHSGTLMKIRLCAIDAIPSNTVPENMVPGQNGKLAVNSRMSAVYLQLAQDAAAAGIALGANEAYRTMARQTYFWNCYKNQNCNSGNKAAEPGHSNHQAAVAVDWNPSVYNWLAGGAATKYNLQKCTCGESWHYSPDGG